MSKPYCLLTEAQKVLARAAKKRWRDRNRAKQRALTIAWQRKNRDHINSNIATDTLQTVSYIEKT
jgi:hypothetical protein